MSSNIYMSRKEPLNVYLKKARQKSGLSQGDVAKELGYSSPQFISNWERGLSSPPLDTLSELVRLYSIPGRELVDVMVHETKQSLLAAVSRKPQRKKA